MRRFGTRMFLVVAFVGGLGWLASSPAMAYCRYCGPGGCYDAGKGEPGYNYCDKTNGYCRQRTSCTGGTQCESDVPGGCIDNDSMMAPEATMVLAAGERRMKGLNLAAEIGMCVASSRPAALDEVVIR